MTTGSPQEIIRFSPESDYYLVPYDLRNSRVLQFLGLQAMGFPVELEKVPVSVVKQSPLFQHDDDNLKWEMEVFPLWARPIATNPQFGGYIEDPDVFGDIFNADNEDIFPEGVSMEVADLLSRPIAEINNDIDMAHVGMLTAALHWKQENNKFYGYRWFRDVSDSVLGLSEECILRRAVVTGLERYQWLESRGQPISTSLWADKADLTEAAIIQSSGVKPLHIEAQIGLVVDYYQLVESLVPKFAAFKR